MNGADTKISKKFKAIIALAACCFAATFAGVASMVSVNAIAKDELTLADYASTFVMDERASIRVNAVNGGLRFTSYVSAEEYNALAAKYGESLVVGTLIAPKDLVANKGELALDNAELTLNKDYVNVTGKFFKSAEEENLYGFNAVISNLKEANYARSFVARSYIKVGDDVAYAANFNKEGRTAFYVATVGLANGSAEGEQVEGYLNSVSAYENASLKVEDVTLFVGETAKVNAVIEGTENGKARSVSVFAELTAGGEEITVSGMEITGVKAGTTAITVKYGAYTATASVTVKAAEVLANGTFLSYENSGADFNLNIPSGETPRILQLTDTQIVNPNSAAAARLSDDERGKYRDLELNVFAHMDKVVEEAKPHFIILTGDNIYGEFDEDYSMVEALIARLDSYGIYWGFAYGNHDRESLVSELAARYSSSEYCLYANASEGKEFYYSVAIKQNGETIRAIYLMDTNSTASAAAKDDLVKVPGMTAEQVNWFARTSAEIIGKSGNANLPASIFTHIPSTQVYEAAKKYGYPENSEFTANEDGDFGCIHYEVREDPWTLRRGERWFALAKSANTDTMFFGHLHENNASITYDGVRLTYGLKTGMYDSYEKGELGGTLMTLNGAEATVRHIYSTDREKETFDYYVSASDTTMYGSLIDASASNEFVLSRTTDENELPENGTGAALKAVRAYAGDGTTGVFNFVRFITYKALTAGQSYKIYFDFKTDTAGVYYVQFVRDNDVLSTATVSAAVGSTPVRAIFTPSVNVDNLQIRVGNGATTNNYTMIFDNLSVSEITVPKEETFDDMYFSGGTGYGLNMNVTNYSANITVGLTDNAAELPEGGSGKALKFTNSGADSRYNFVAITTNKAVTAGSKYLISFNIKTISGTYNSILQVYQNGAVTKTFSGLSQGKVELIYEATADCANMQIYFTDGATAAAYAVTVDNVYVAELKTTATTPFDKEDYENAIIAENASYGVMETVVAKTAGVNTTASLAKFAMYTAEDETYRPANGTGKYLALEVTNGTHTYTWINFNFGAVEAGKKYNFYLDAKETVLSGATKNVHFALTTSTDPRVWDSSVRITDVAYFAASMQTFSFSHTFTESHDNVSLWFQIVASSSSDHIVYAFDNVKMTEVNA